MRGLDLVEPLKKLIRTSWHREPGMPFAKAKILAHEIHPEGLDVYRIRFYEAGNFAPESTVGHIISTLRGSGRLHLAIGNRQSFHIEANVHFYLPPGSECVIEADPLTEFLCVSSASAAQSRGKNLLIRDETFLNACASGSQSLRWILTPQYLSRRIFLHHDPILLSKSGNPVSWFRTTMFDVAGLPANDEGKQVFKMAYNTRTEFNVCYDVKGDASVRMAKYSHEKREQGWGPWLSLDGDSTYHLNETHGAPVEEPYRNAEPQPPQFLRNKHEVRIVDGYVTLYCLFDPAPTGVECHRPGEYSDYDPLSDVLGTKRYEAYIKEIYRYDEMLNKLSFAKAQNGLRILQGTPIWELYLQGRKAQEAIESDLIKSLAAEGNGRERILSPWMQTLIP